MWTLEPLLLSLVGAMVGMGGGLVLIPALTIGEDIERAIAVSTLVSTGIAILPLTPYLRVLVSVVFLAAVEHDSKYTTFTGFVLAVLT